MKKKHSKKDNVNGKKILPSMLKEIFNETKFFLFGFFIILFIYSMVMYIGSYLWVNYSGFTVCEQFLRQYIYRSYNLAYLFSHNIWRLSLHIHLIILAVCFTTATICKFFLVNDYFYDVTGAIGKLFFWILPNTIIIAYIVEKYYIFDYQTSFIICFIPTIFLNHYCIRFTSLVIPDLGDIQKVLIIIYRKIKSFFTFSLSNA